MGSTSRDIEVHIDFETFSERPLRGKKSVGSCRYAEDPSTHPWCLGWAINQHVPNVWVLGERKPYQLFEAVADGARVYAWNAEFEIPVWEEQCVRKMGWPAIPFDQWRDPCTAALALSLPADLAKCCIAPSAEALPTF